MNNILLADIGHTHFHVYDGKKVMHCSYDDAIEKYKAKRLCYISVKKDIEEKISHISMWNNISSKIVLNNSYDTMGVDRKAFCLSHSDGVFVDVGTAITVDVMEAGVYLGGYILPGIKAMLKSYREISPALDVQLNENIALDKFPKTTKDGISYGIIASIKTLLNEHRLGKRLYMMGGDGKLLASFFDDAIFDEMLIFNGMKKAIKEYNLC